MLIFSALALLCVNQTKIAAARERTDLPMTVRRIVLALGPLLASSISSRGVMGGGGYPRCRWWGHHWLLSVDADVALIRRLVVTESGSRHVRQRGRHRASARTS